MTANGGVVGGAAGRILEARRKKERDRERDRGRSGSRRRKGQWKKLLWVKQAYPDNYTDEETFLDHLQRNPRLQPYEFWPLVADSTVIVQHVMSVVIFICCFTGIVQERVTPFAVVSSGSLGTVLGWVLWDFWVGQEEDAEAMADASDEDLAEADLDSWSTRNQRRVTTIKSAVLIYCALLGLSPILKSLTKSTTSDSIWAMTSVLMCINVCFFDYGGGVGAKFPASLSTNAAIMAASVLASRLESTTDVFSCLLFSIEVFGLFPVFRRHLRFVSWPGHLTLTIFLVMGAGAGFSLAVSGGTWKAAITGVVLGSILTGLVMGICSWWLIGLQKYKNEIHGPWDPAQPIIRRRWD
ncbi:phosphatidylinositol N-acetylglucosaminyltransferase subunit C [Phyllosticta citricarpa]|uniref:Phosphatidylinositol N-acetylglucosaminyltransferase subunit C n=1 Tax=Phyllosticta citricarpa TaxID=55181 RepID=A0ABR1MK60_9PEZI